jgi:hypothetical protein
MRSREGTFFLEIDILPWHIVKLLLGNIPLGPPDTFLKVCPIGHMLHCREVTCATVDKIKDNLYFHTFHSLS